MLSRAASNVLLALQARFCYSRGMTTNLDTLVRAALVRNKGEWQTIADESGVSYSWLSKFVNGHIDNPGYMTLKKLHEYLSASHKTGAA
jgi:transcriptional regulator with XRE-family HTH domain